MRAAIRARLEIDAVGTGFGSLASGADILFAEELLGRGARLEAVLPFDRDEFVEISVRPAGPAWVERFEACLRQADSVHYATTDRYLNDQGLFAYCSRLAMGMAVLRARHLGVTVAQVAVWDGRSVAGQLAGTEADMNVWRDAGLPVSVITCASEEAQGHSSLNLKLSTRSSPRSLDRIPRAMLFGDLKGFGKLTEAQIARVLEHVLTPLGHVMRGYDTEIAFVNTWGDGLFGVFEDPRSAAHCALDLQRAMVEIDLLALGLPSALALRIGGHYGPVYVAEDPILRRPNVFGTHVTRAARIEPITPEGSVYVTLPFAAALALAGLEKFACAYVGMTEGAKGIGSMPMFLLSRARERC
ncbi:adenylate/guanylate cyclase domain-containing protein [Methylobacterium sp. P31]